MYARRVIGAALAALCLLLIVAPVDARRGRPVAPSPDPVGYVVDDRYPHLRMPEATATARAWRGWKGSSLGAPARFIAGRLTCAINVNAALAERGIRGTGSAMAKSFLSWGRPTGPVPGAVAVFHRGAPRAPTGHVAIVASVSSGEVMIWNPTPHGWRLMPQHRRAISYRIPS
jgi:hypothetical protein